VTPYAAPPVTEDDNEPRSPWTLVGRVAVIVLALSLAAMWIFAFFGDHGVPGRLEDPVFPALAQPVCEATQDRIDQLPRADQTPTAAGRADVVDQATDDLDAMLVELRGLVPARTAATEHEVDAVTQWIDDWQIYVQDRRDYTAQLRVDPMTRFAVTQSDRDKRQVTSALDRFAEINGMGACTIPDDLS
jgi:hypothetical protein